MQRPTMTRECSNSFQSGGKPSFSLRANEALNPLAIVLSRSISPYPISRFPSQTESSYMLFVYVCSFFPSETLSTGEVLHRMLSGNNKPTLERGSPYKTLHNQSRLSPQRKHLVETPLRKPLQHVIATINHLLSFKTSSSLAKTRRA